MLLIKITTHEACVSTMKVQLLFFCLGDSTVGDSMRCFYHFDWQLNEWWSCLPFLELLGEAPSTEKSQLIHALA